MFKPIKTEDESRDRYNNIRPYSHNIVRAKSKTGHKITHIFVSGFVFIGSPPSNYINASWVKFPKDQMKYIATQAPLRKKNDISGIETFWEMILDKKVTLFVCKMEIRNGEIFPVKVTLIVMLTKLEEQDERGNSKRKADQYWPEVKQASLEFPRSQVRVEQLPHRRAEQGGFVYRRDISGPVSHCSKAS